MNITPLSNENSILIYTTDEMQSIYTGQSLDLYWTYNLVCPSISQYLKMVDKSESLYQLILPYNSFSLETGGLFLLLSKLMGACSPVGCDRDIDSLTILIGRLYQIRDDYQNLISKDVIAPFGPL